MFEKFSFSIVWVQILQKTSTKIELEAQDIYWGEMPVIDKWVGNSREERQGESSDCNVGLTTVK